MKKLAFLLIVAGCISCNSKKTNDTAKEIFGGLKLGVKYNVVEQILSTQYKRTPTGFYFKDIALNNTPYYFVPIFIWNTDSILLKADIPVYQSYSDVMSVRSIALDKSLKFDDEHGVQLSTNNTRNDEQMLGDLLRVLQEKYGAYRYEKGAPMEKGQNFDIGVEYYNWDVQDMKVRLIHTWSFTTYPTREVNMFRVHLQYSLKDEYIKEQKLDKYYKAADNF